MEKAILRLSSVTKCPSLQLPSCLVSKYELSKKIKKESVGASKKGEGERVETESYGDLHCCILFLCVHIVIEMLL